MSDVPIMIQSPLRVLWGFSRLLIGKDTDEFDNGALEPWRGIGQRVGHAPCATRLSTLKYELGCVVGIDVDEFLTDVNAVAPTQEPPMDDEELETPTLLPPPAAFPINALPSAMRSYVIEGAASLCCPPEYIAVPMLAAAGAAFGTSVRLQLKLGWYELPSLYIAVIAPSGSKKSPALDMAVEFTRAKGLEYFLSYQGDLQNYERLEAEYQIERDARKRTHDKATLPDLPDKPVKPILKRTWVDDSTLEALAQKLHENTRGLALVRDELAGLLNSFNQYRGGRGSDLQFLLSTWSCQPTAIDRKHDPNPLILHRPLIAIIGTIQPAVLVKVFGADRLHDGFTARFFFADPEVMPYRSSDVSISEAAYRSAKTMFDGLYRIHPANAFAEIPEPQLVRLSPGARRQFVDFEGRIGLHLDAFSSDDPFRAPLSKLPGYLGRIALILHACEWASHEHDGFDVLDEQTMSAAIQILEYFQSHTRRVWRRLSESSEDSQMRQVVNWLSRKGRPMTARDMARNGVAGFKNPREAETLLQRMKDCGLVNPMSIGQTVRYTTNPGGGVG